MSKLVRHPIPVDGSIDGERHVRRSAHPPGGRGRHAAKETDNGRSRGEERRRGRNVHAERLKRAVIRGKDTFPSVDRARARTPR